jgi:hypothetical protein
VKLTAAGVIVNEILQYLKIIEQKRYLCLSSFIQETIDKKVSFSDYIYFDRYSSHRYPVCHSHDATVRVLYLYDGCCTGRAGTS